MAYQEGDLHFLGCGNVTADEGPADPVIPELSRVMILESGRQGAKSASARLSKSQGFVARSAWGFIPRPTPAGIPDGDDVARLDVAHLRAHVASWEDVRQEEYLLVRQPVLDLKRADIGERHPRVFGLPPA